MFLGMNQSLRLGVHSLVVVGDSLLILSQTKNYQDIMDQIAGRIHKHIGILSQFQSLLLFHDQREHNSLVHDLGNQASHLP